MISTIIAIIFGITTIILLVKRKPRKTDLDLKNHILFESFDMFINKIILVFSLENKGKEMIFRDILFVKFNLWKEKLNSIVDKCIAATTNEELLEIHMKCFEDTILEYRKFYDDSKFIDELGLEYNDMKTLEVVMEKFIEWNKNSEDDMKARIIETCNSPIIDGVVLKSILIFNTYNDKLNDVINNGARTLNTINGELTGKSYKGIVI